MGLFGGVREVGAAQVGRESFPNRPGPAAPLHVPASGFRLSLPLSLLSFRPFAVNAYRLGPVCQPWEALRAWAGPRASHHPPPREQSSAATEAASAGRPPRRGPRRVWGGSAHFSGDVCRVLRCLVKGLKEPFECIRTVTLSTLLV